MTKIARAIQHVFYADPDQYPPIVNSVRLLAAAGYRTDICCRFTGEGVPVAWPEQVSILRIDKRGAGSWRGYLGFVREAVGAACGDACVFVGHDMHGFLPAWLLSRRYRRPLVYHCHELIDDSSTLSPGGQLVLEFQRRFARTADLVVVPDHERAEIMQKGLGLASMPLVAVNAPVRRPTCTGHRLQEALDARGVKFRKIVLRQGSVGPSHALEATIQSMPSWSDREWGFVVMGRGREPYLAHLRSLAEACGVTERFVALPAVSYDEVLQFTGGADVGHALYVPVDSNNRFSTTASNKLLEYMASALPVIVSDRPGLRAFVETHQCGMTADEGSPQSIAAAVNTLLGDPGLSRRLGEAGARAFEEELNYERQFAPVLEAIQSLCRASGGDRA